MIKSHTFQNIEKLPFEEGVPSQIKVQNMKNWLNNNNDKYNLKYVVMYHGTGVNIPILEQGLKPTSITRRRSYQSTSNYVYNLNNAKKKDYIIVVEGIIDCLKIYNIQLKI